MNKKTLRIVCFVLAGLMILGIIAGAIMSLLG